MMNEKISGSKIQAIPTNAEDFLNSVLLTRIGFSMNFSENAEIAIASKAAVSGAIVVDCG
jgi:hypothetical protein